MRSEPSVSAAQRSVSGAPPRGAPDEARVALAFRFLSRWRPGQAPDALRLHQLQEAFAARDGVLWFEWEAPMPTPEGEPYDHTALCERLAGLDFNSVAGPAFESRVKPRLDALADARCWTGATGLARPGLYADEGVITATEVAMCPAALLREIRARCGSEEIAAKCGLLSNPISFVVLPGCLVTIRWRPVVEVAFTPVDDPAERMRQLWLRQNVTLEPAKLRSRVQKRWVPSSKTLQSGDIAVMAIAELSRSFAATRVALGQRLHDVEDSLYSMLLLPADDAQPAPARPPRAKAADARDGWPGWMRDTVTWVTGESLDDDAADRGELAPEAELRDLTKSRMRFLEVAYSIATFQRAVAPLRSYTGPMEFVGDEDALNAVRDLFDTTLEELRGLRRDLRSALDTISSVNATSALEVAQRQQRLAQLQADSAKQQEARLRRVQHRVEVLGAIVIPAGLVAAAFGANVWLPGRDKLAGTLMLIAGMLIAVVGTMVWIATRPTRQRKP